MDLIAATHEETRDNVAMAEALRRLKGKDPTARNALRRYSRGELSRGVAMDRLGLEHYGQLLDVLGRTGLPMPRCPPEQIAAMVKVILDVFDQADEASDQPDKP